MCSTNMYFTYNLSIMHTLQSRCYRRTLNIYAWAADAADTSALTAAPIVVLEECTNGTDLTVLLVQDHN
jgi:hypothetical protein